MCLAQVIRTLKVLRQKRSTQYSFLHLHVAENVYDSQLAWQSCGGERAGSRIVDALDYMNFASFANFMTGCRLNFKLVCILRTFIPSHELRSTTLPIYHIMDITLTSVDVHCLRRTNSQVNELIQVLPNDSFSQTASQSHSATPALRWTILHGKCRNSSPPCKKRRVGPLQ